MERDERRYPVSEEKFNELVLPIIESSYIGKGRPPKVSYYRAFCGITYVPRTGIPRRDLPAEFGEWHTVYDRFNRGNARGLWNKVLVTLQSEVGLSFGEVITDSTTVKVHRHGGGQKGGVRAKGRPAQG